MTAMQPPLAFDSRAEQIRRAFETFHASNPHVWGLFEQFAREAIAAGHRNYSADSICHRIRWETEVQTRIPNDETRSAFKLNNNFTAYYARMFHAAHPEHGEFFRNRALISKHQPAGQEDNS